MCVQTILPQMSPDQIRAEVRLRHELFAQGGFILGPSHAIQANTPVENVMAMLEEAELLND